MVAPSSFPEGRRSSGVEHALGKGGVACSIHAGGTSFRSDPPLESAPKSGDNRPMMDAPVTDSASAVWVTLRRFLHDARASWNIGTFGAIAEFHRDPEEPVAIKESDRAITVLTARGGIRVLRHPEARLVPYEGLSTLPSAWTQGVMVCLPAATAAMAARPVLSEIGLDAGALKAADRSAPLFDLGLGVPHLDASVRSADPALVRLLRGGLGRPLFDPANPALAAIKETSPDRVFVSRLGRVEVYQPIGSRRRDIPAPQGPHTHVLPELLKHGRTHAATVPVPEGWVPALAFFPANPARDDKGALRPFDRAAFEEFEDLLARFGNPATVQTKRSVRDAVRAGRGPEGFAASSSRAARASLRVTLRQMLHTDGPTPALDAWRERFDPTADIGAISDDAH